MVSGEGLDKEYLGSDRGCAIANLNAELFCCLGQRRLLQHLVLHDHLLVGINGAVCVIGVVA